MQFRMEYKRHDALVRRNHEASVAELLPQAQAGDKFRTKFDAFDALQAPHGYYSEQASKSKLREFKRTLRDGKHLSLEKVSEGFLNNA